jgi:hypothetical protein
MPPDSLATTSSAVVVAPTHRTSRKQERLKVTRLVGRFIGSNRLINTRKTTSIPKNEFKKVSEHELHSGMNLPVAKTPKIPHCVSHSLFDSSVSGFRAIVA